MKIVFLEYFGMATLKEEIIQRTVIKVQFRIQWGSVAKMKAL